MQEFINTTLYKRYVNVIVETDRLGQLKPLYIRWENQQLFKVDKILEVRKAVSVVGGAGILYRILVNGQEKHLFYEINRWFIESKAP